MSIKGLRFYTNIFINHCLTSFGGTLRTNVGNSPNFVPPAQKAARPIGH